MQPCRFWLFQMWRSMRSFFFNEASVSKPSLAKPDTLPTRQANLQAHIDCSLPYMSHEKVSLRSLPIFKRFHCSIRHPF